MMHAFKYVFDINMNAARINFLSSSADFGFHFQLVNFIDLNMEDIFFSDG